MLENNFETNYSNWADNSVCKIVCSNSLIDLITACNSE